MKVPEKAEKEYQKAIEINPEYSSTHCCLGNILKISGREAEAKQAYRKAIELDPKFSPAHYNLGDLFQNSGRNTEAVQAYRKAIKYNSENSAEKIGPKR